MRISSWVPCNIMHRVNFWFKSMQTTLYDNVSVNVVSFDWANSISPDVNTTWIIANRILRNTFWSISYINLMRPIQNGRHFPDDIFKYIFLNEIVWISIRISLKFVPKGPINYIPTLVQTMAWRRAGDKPLSEPMTVSLLTYICVMTDAYTRHSS